MRKGVLIALCLLLALGLAACAEQETAPSVSEQSSVLEQSDNSDNEDILESQSSEAEVQESSENNTDEAEKGEQKLKLVIEGQEFDVTLYDTPAANSLYDMLPLELTFEDFNGIEKIAYLDNELTTEGEPDGCDPDVGDLCLYAPWGNLSIFYNDFRYSNSLIKLGHIDSGMDIISSMDEDFSASLEKAE